MRPGAAALADFAAKRLAPDARVLDIPDEGTMMQLRGGAVGPFDAILCAWPSLSGPLMPFLASAHEALTPGSGEVIVCDIVWQTAPTPELLRAFAPPAGRERVRPIEGYEMQAEHSGFDIAARASVDRKAWVPALAPDVRAAVEGDARGAAKLALWAFRRSADE